MGTKQRLTLIISAITGALAVYGAVRLNGTTELFNKTATVVIVSLVAVMFVAIVVTTLLTAANKEKKFDQLVTDLDNAFYAIDPYGYSDSINFTPVSWETMRIMGYEQTEAELLRDIDETFRSFLSFVEDVEIDEEIEDIVEKAKKSYASYKRVAA